MTISMRNCVVIGPIDYAIGGSVEDAFITSLRGGFWRRLRACWFLLFPPRLPDGSSPLDRLST